MSNLLVRDLDEEIVNALKLQAASHGRSAEAEHREILREVLLKPKKKTFAEVLMEIPDVGMDSDFQRVQQSENKHVFD